MLTKIDFGSKYCRKDGDILNKQQKLLGDLRKERIRKLHIECNKYIEIPSYLKRELAEIEFHNQNQK